MGGKSGGGARTPVEAPNTLWTAQSLRILDAVSEGVVEGFANGNAYPFKSIFLDDTPVQNPDGTYNFKGVNGYFLRGAQDQPYVPGFSATERSVAIATRVKKDVQVVRTITDDQVSRLRVTVGVNRNMQVKSGGDSVPTTTTLILELVNAAGVKAAQSVNFIEKSSGVAYVDRVFSDLPATPFNLRVTRVTEDAKDDKTSNETYVSGYVEIIDAKLNYPHTALAALELDSDQFGSSTPRRNYLIKGRVVRVPSNYNPETRVYSGTLWDGTFKSAWTNNPAWVFYDLLTSERVSTLARRMSAADIDKWGLYKVARYCDQLVDDGFGGKEPRFVCNAYIADTRQAGELLTDLASVFCGMPVWNGTQVSVTLDMDSDPVASYTNSNVVDGAFTYSGVALKAIHTAVHVQYVDKYDGYRTKTEYVEDSEAVKRYGLNIKSVTAFGCDSRGQASRFGAWILQTALRQQHALSFTVGREGMKHLPYDIIQVADNNYAGAQISGRVLAVAGRVLTLDKEVESAVGAMLSYVTEAGVKTVKVTAQPAGDKVQLETAVPIAEMDTWVLSEPVKSRLYRAMGVSENTSDGTYTIAALLHDPRKYAVVDGWADFDKEITTLHTLTPELINTAVEEEGGTLKVTWDSTTTSGEILSYDIVIYRNGQRYRELTSSTPEFSLEGLPNGDYYAEIRGKNARGTLSEPKIVAWSINYTLTGLRTTPQMFAIGLNWVLPKVGVSKTRTEIWYATKNDISAATKLAALPYPQTTYTLTDVKISDRYWFWARLVDDAGNTGEFTPAAAGVCSTDTEAIVEQIQGAITESSLSQELIGLLSDNDRKAQEAAELTAAQDSARKVAAEAAARTAAIQAETNARIQAVNSAADKASRDLLAKANELGTKITNVENVNATQAQQINTVTAAQGVTAAGLETEKKARADGDAAEAAARTALAARVTNAEGSIVANELVRVERDKVHVEASRVLGGRIGNAEGKLTTLEEVVTTSNGSTALKIERIQAQYDNLQIGGVNLLNDSAYAAPSVWDNAANTRFVRATFNEMPGVRVDVTTAFTGCTGISGATGSRTSSVQAGQQYTLSFYIQGTAHFQAVGGNYVYLINNESVANQQLERVPITHITTKVSVTFTAAWTSDSVHVLIAANGTFAAGQWYSFFGVMLEEGNKASSWKLSPADNTAALAADAKSKADAAQKAAETAAQTKADAAKAQAIATASGDATSKANAAEAAAKADAAVKDAALKQQAAADAQTKSDKAKADAIAEAKKVTDKITADFDDYKKAKATEDTAMTLRVQNAESQVGANKSSIENLQTTRATKTEVATLARTSLKAEWESYTDNVKVGGVNVLNASTYADGVLWSTYAGSVVKVTSTFRGATLTTVKVSANVTGQVGTHMRVEDRTSVFAQGQQYTLSFYAQGTPDFVQSGLNYLYLMREDGNNHYLGKIGISSSLSAKRHEMTFTAPWTTEKGSLLIAANGTFTADQWFAFHSVKIERGNKATDWAPSNGDAKSAIETIERAQAAANTASAERFSAVEATLGTSSARLSAVETAIVTNNSAMASRVSTVEAQTGQNTASITSTSNAVTSLTGKVSALHTVKVETISGGRKVVAGTALGVDGATGDSQFLVYANKFGMVNPSSKQIDTPFTVTTNAGGSAQMALKGDFIATDSILARHIAANQSIVTPVLTAPTINAGQLNSTAINNGNGNFTVDAAGNLYAKSGTFEGTVRADKIEGDTLKMYVMSRLDVGVYRLSIPNLRANSIAIIVNCAVFLENDLTAGRHFRTEVWLNGDKIEETKNGTSKKGTYNGLLIGGVYPAYFRYIPISANGVIELFNYHVVNNNTTKLDFVSEPLVYVARA